MERTLTHRPRGGFILTPLCSNTNSAERKSCPSGEGEGRVVCGVWEPNLRSTGRVGLRLPARQGMAPRVTQCVAQLPEWGLQLQVLQLSLIGGVLSRTPTQNDAEDES